MPFKMHKLKKFPEIFRHTYYFFASLWISLQSVIVAFPGHTQLLYSMMVNLIHVSYCMFCTSVREDNPRALASVHKYNHSITSLLHQHACALCTLWDILYLIKTL